MKKMLINAIAMVLISGSIVAQDSGSNKKLRAGIKFAMQPSWYTSGNTNTIKNKAAFGYGFGLVLDFRLSDVIYFSTGIGGDFEGGSLKYRDDGYNPSSAGASTVFVCNYIMDNGGNFVDAANDKDIAEYSKVGYTTYSLKSRKIKTTHVTIPITLKMLTNEYSGIKYFGQFGGELGIRTAAKATDEYSYTQVVSNATLVTVSPGGTNSNISIQKDCAIVPIRVGMNIGGGLEYRLGGSTSVMFSVNFFKSFTNLMRTDSKLIYTGATIDANNKVIFTHLQQDLKMSAVRINIGLMF